MMYRVQQLIFLRRIKKLLGNRIDPVTAPKVKKDVLQNLKLPVFFEVNNFSSIEKILNGRVFTHNTSLESIEKYEYKYSHTFLTDIKTNGHGPDIRTVWEPARLQHIALLISYIIRFPHEKDTVHIKEFAKINVIKWINENPFPYGPHYISAMECGLRVPVFFYCLKVLDNLTDDEIRLIFDTLYRHTWWVSKRLSLFSSSGNHTIAEAIGLIFGGIVFIATGEGRRWFTEGNELLKRELSRQILTDGGPAEQSLNYHRFVLDLYWLAIDFQTLNGFLKIGDVQDRLISAERFMAAFQRNGGGCLSIGDSDDGYAIAPGLHPRRIIPPKSPQEVQTFVQSGYTTIRKNNVVFSLDHGSLGLSPLYNHGHADALSICLLKNGKEMLVDPGTYRYNGESEYRQYFKSTRAHNTITIDDQDQAKQETSFIWSHPFKAKLIKNTRNDKGLFLRATHNGYKRLQSPVLHIRSISISDGLDIFIEDTFEGEGEHKFELNYHFHPHSNLTELDDGWWEVNNKGATVYIKIVAAHNVSIVKGQENPILGWFSPSYGIKHQSWTLQLVQRGISKNISFITVIGLETRPDSHIIKEKLSQIERTT